MGLLKKFDGKTWQVNGLVYTAGGLILLFVLMLTGDFAWAFKDRSVAMITKVLFKKYGASDFLNGLLISSIPLILGVILTPIVSYRSDRHRGKLGRRIPYLLVTTPIAVVAMIGLAFSPMAGEWLAGFGLNLNTTTLILLGTFWMLFEFAMMIAGAVFNAFANDVIPPELLGRFFGLFRIISLIAGIIFSYWLLGWCGTHSMWLFLGVAVLYGAGMMLLCFKIKEGKYPPPPVEMPGQSKFQALGATKTYFKECFGNPYYILVFVVLLLLPLGAAPYNAFCVFYAEALGLTLGDFGRFMSYSFVVSALLAFPVGALADKFHPLRVCVILAGLSLFIMVTCGLFITGPRMVWVAEHVITLLNSIGFDVVYNAHEAQRLAFGAAEISCSVTNGLYATASASLAMRLLPRDRFAQFSSAAGLLSCGVNIVIIPLVGLILDCTGNNYLHLFWMGAFFNTFGVLGGIILYIKFVKLGGPKNYTPPPVETKN